MRGGARKGAGRPAGSKKQNNRVSLTVRIPPSMSVWLEKQHMSKSRIVEKAVDILIKEQTK